jgi:adenylate cyclase
MLTKNLQAEILKLVRDRLPDLDPGRMQGLEAELQGLFTQSQAAYSRREHEVTILLSDLRGFTALSERFDAASVVQVLNHYFPRMNEIIFRYGGVIDKYMGDAIMVVFGVPDASGSDARRAVACAIEMQIAMDDVNREIAAEGLPEVFMGIGINTGRVSAGQLGSDLHSEYTVIGDAVNLASRIEAHSLRGQVLLSENTFQKVRDVVDIGERREVSVKGKSEAVVLHEVLSCHWGESLELPRREMRTSPRVPFNGVFMFQKVDGKDVQSEQHRADAVDLSYMGVSARSTVAVAENSQIRLSISAGLLASRSSDIYATIRMVRPEGESCWWAAEFTYMEPEARDAIKATVDRIVLER